MSKVKIKNCASAEKLRKEIVKFLTSHTVSLAALARVSKTSQPSLQSAVTLKTAFNPTTATVDKLRAAMQKIHDNPSGKF